ncbi:uncharacterized protein [Physcomitrium patens]|uniref:Uncharacterized protein n=2 Tax=Physcomitrium patens TaxID=3218 RepID=A0A2K1KIT7_PHYPA|nr:uncharacterized protein LOC112282061 isoform X1 [Physcomitrium patens]PNR53690.1 hypothetical protein PHYPA_007365 [Physcomitrium patens]|eukprot:XP_024374991.1 uncharacterized protein LOC112282061 isoform X1 [Physcomitrella patens]
MTAAMPVAPISAAPRPPAAASTHSAPSNATPAPPKDVRQEIQKEIANLETGDHLVMAKAAASIVMLATLPDAVPSLEAAIPHLVPLLQDISLSVHVQRNACAALTSIMTADPSLYLAAAKTPMLGEGLVQCLKGDGESPFDEGLQLNAAAGISVLAQSVEGLLVLQEADAENAIISSLCSASDANVKEEIVDALCALSSHPDIRNSLFLKGAVEQLAKVIQGASAEICVRGLLGLGMLCGSSSEAQVQLASVEGTVDTLMALMKSSDHDIKSISRDLFRVLMQNQEVKPILEHQLRNSTLQ